MKAKSGIARPPSCEAASAAVGWSTPKPKSMAFVDPSPYSRDSNPNMACLLVSEGADDPAPVEEACWVAMPPTVCAPAASEPWADECREGAVIKGKSASVPVAGSLRPRPAAVAAAGAVVTARTSSARRSLVTVSVLRHTSHLPTLLLTLTDPRPAFCEPQPDVSGNTTET